MGARMNFWDGIQPPALFETFFEHNIMDLGQQA
jgi:hypothetical protein